MVLFFCIVVFFSSCNVLTKLKMIEMFSASRCVTTTLPFIWIENSHFDVVPWILPMRSVSLHPFSECCWSKACSSELELCSGSLTGSPIPPQSHQSHWMPDSPSSYTSIQIFKINLEYCLFPGPLRPKDLIDAIRGSSGRMGSGARCGTCFGQKNSIEVARPWCACALS